MKCNEQVIEMDGKFTCSILPSLRCKLFPHICVDLIKNLDSTITRSDRKVESEGAGDMSSTLTQGVIFFFELEITGFFFCVHQKVLHLISKETAILRYHWHFVFTGWLHKSL